MRDDKRTAVTRLAARIGKETDGDDGVGSAIDRTVDAVLRFATDKDADDASGDVAAAATASSASLRVGVVKSSFASSGGVTVLFTSLPPIDSLFLSAFIMAVVAYFLNYFLFSRFDWT
jgi:hypothetical protein